MKPDFYTFTYRLFILRFKQICRILLLAGAVRIVVIFSILLLLMAAAFVAAENGEYAWKLTGIWTAVVILIHSKRNDKNFLRLITSASTGCVCIFEYFVLSIPVTVCLLINKMFLQTVALMAVISFVAFLNPKKTGTAHRYQGFLQNYIPTYLIEWKAGIRSNFYILLIIWILGLLFSFFIAAVPVAVLLIGLIVIDFYQSNESWQILLSSGFDEHKLLKYKIIQNFKLFSLTVCPLVLLFLAFHCKLWYVMAIELVIFYVIHCFSIILKYAYYSWDRQTSFRSVLAGVGFVAGMIPVTTPILALFTVYLYFKAIHNLKFYLHDYN